MPYGHRAGTIRAFEFGCTEPQENAGLAIEQMRERYRYWNLLVELSTRHWHKRETIIGTQDPEERKILLRDETIRTQLRDLDRETIGEARQIGHTTCLTWMNADDVLVDWQNARRRHGDRRPWTTTEADTSNKPRFDGVRFHAWTGDGKTMVRWQTGLPTSEIATDTRIQIEPAHPLAFSPIRSERRRHNFTTLRLRVGSDERRRPVWCTTTVFLHRPLPTGLLRQAHLLRERVGISWRWKIVVLIEIPDEVTTPTRVPTLSMDIGWRLVDEGIRVAAWQGSDGAAGTVIVPRRMIDAIVKCDDIRSIRDRRFTAAQDALGTWLRGQTPPAWLGEATTTLRQWRKIGRLASVVVQWRDRRFDGDAEIFPTLEAWRQRDRHLLNYESHLRDRVLRQRRELYRITAAELSRRYGAVIVEDFDLRPMAAVRKNRANITPIGGELPATVRRNRTIAASSLLRLAIKNAFERDHGPEAFVKQDPAYTTQECHRCGTIERFDAARHLVYTCRACGATWDQDQNAAQNLQKRAAGELVATA